MKLKLTKHFQERFGERNINMDDVKSAIRNPDTKAGVLDGKFKVTKRIGSRMIEVVYCHEGFKDRHDQYLLITVYYK